MLEDTLASDDHEAVLCYKAGKRIKVTTDNGKVYGTVVSMNVGISGEAAYAIVTDKTNGIIILNHKQLEAGIKACGLGSKVAIELSYDNDDDDYDDNDNNIDSKKKNTASIATTPTTVPLPHIYTTPLKNNNHKDHINNKYNINQKVENMNVDNADNNTLHSQKLLDLVTDAIFKLDELKIGLLRYMENVSKLKTSKRRL